MIFLHILEDSCLNNLEHEQLLKLSFGLLVTLGGVSGVALFITTDEQLQ